VVVGAGTVVVAGCVVVSAVVVGGGVVVVVWCVVVGTVAVAWVVAVVGAVGAVDETVGTVERPRLPDDTPEPPLSVSTSASAAPPPSKTSATSSAGRRMRLHRRRGGLRITCVAAVSGAAETSVAAVSSP
jgi:hypothetical protein